MNVVIYQIPVENNFCYRSYSFIYKMCNKRIPSEIYSIAYSGKLDAETLEDIFRILNVHHPKDYKARSLSVSDVVEIKGRTGKSKFYFCDTIGFVPISFNKELI